MDGILVVDKPKGPTSRDVVNQVSKILGTKKVGHTGTLDPIATGVLVLTIGKGTKLTEMLQASTKEYIATAMFGIETDTLDTEGTIIKEEPVTITKEDVKRALKEMEGTYEQEVPIYSAIKVNGKKLYEHARKNEQVEELPKRTVTIYETEFLSFEENQATFRVVVSKGTYIRSFIRDLAKKLNTVAIMSDLRRTKQGTFPVEESHPLEEITKDTKLISLIDAVSIPKQEATGEIFFKIKNGAVLEFTQRAPIVLWTNNGKALAIYEQDGPKIRPKTMILEQESQ